MQLPHRLHRLTFALTVAAAAVGCGGGEGVTPPPTTGTLEITTSTSEPLGQALESEVAVMNRDGSSRMTLTDHPGFDFEPVWSPDGTKIVFTRSENSNTEIYVMNADGGNQTNVSNRPDTRETTPDWNGQGAVMVASRQSAFYKSWLRANHLEANCLRQ